MKKLLAIFLIAAFSAHVAAQSPALSNVAKLNAIKVVTDPAYAGGAKCDGATDDTAAIQAAINAVPTAGGSLYVPRGTCITTRLTLKSNLEIYGDGPSATIIKLKNTTNDSALYGTGVTDVVVRDLTLDGNQANNAVSGTGLRIEGSSSRIWVSRVKVINWRQDGIGLTGTGSYASVSHSHAESNIRDGISVAGMTRSLIIGNTLKSNGRFGVVVGSGSNETRLEGNISDGNTGAGIAVVSVSDIVAVGNHLRGNGEHGLQFNTVTRGLMSGNHSHSNTLSGFDVFAGQYTTVTGNVSYLNTVRGIEVDSVSVYTTVTGNVVYRNGQEGISVFRAATTAIIGNQVLENSTSSSGTYPGVRLWDTAGTFASANVRIIGNNISDDRGGSATQGYAISLENSSSATVIIGNKLTPNVTGAINGAAGQALHISANQGYVTENSGTDTIASGSTTKDVTHGLAVTPLAEEINVVFTEQGTNNYGRWWISNITSTQFRVNVTADPGASNLDLSWHAIVNAARH